MHDTIVDLLNEVSDILYELEIDSNPDLWLATNESETDDAVVIQTSGLVKFNSILRENTDDNVKNLVDGLHNYLYEVLRLKINNQWFNDAKFIVMQYHYLNEVYEEVFYLEY